MSSHENNRYVVIDTSAFIDAGVDIMNLNYGKAFTVPAVINEARDSKTKIKLKYLQSNVCLRCPLTNHINYVIDFSSKLGEYRSLSEVDIQIIALTCELFEERGGLLKQTPSEIKHPIIVKQEFDNSKRVRKSNLPGFYDSEWIIKSKDSTYNCECDPVIKQCIDDLLDIVISNEIKSKAWITPKNIDKFKAGKMKKNNENYTVACLTTDFVMQNVLKHMGIPAIGLNGKVIKSVRRYSRFCIVCQRIVSETEKKCYKCGGVRVIEKIRVYSKPNGRAVYIQNDLNKPKRRTKSPLPSQQSMKCGKPAKKLQKTQPKSVLTDLGVIDIETLTGKSRRLAIK
ncbi:hypothetical protein GJ496_005440 [Pomphorhynchus laevis]|nr:hypothetical protein GJ496_005440 [Pomphorhynchus laevis]